MRNQKDALKTFQLLHSSMRWRLFIDGYRQNEGRGAFDLSEPGYMEAMDNAYVRMLESFEEPLSSAIIEQLHEDALSSVDNTDNEHAGEFRDDAPGDFGLRASTELDGTQNMSGNVSLDGLREFMATNMQDEVVVSSIGRERDRFAIYFEGNDENLLKIMTPEEIYSLLQTQLHKPDQDKKQIRFVVGHEPKTSLRTRVDSILDQYHQSLAVAQNQEETLLAIIRMVAQLEKNHVFADGNIRTLVMLVLNRELVKHRFTPVILDNPNQFDMFSTGELLAAVHHGMDVFLQCAQNSKTLYTKDRLAAQQGGDATQTHDEEPDPPISEQNNTML